MEKNNIKLERELTVRLPEHQLGLSFNNDSDTEVFEEWWSDIGKELFEDYLLDKNF